MTTMRRWLETVLIVSAVTALGSAALADDSPKKRPVGALSEANGITQVTDGEGRPVDLAAHATTPNHPGLGVEKKVPVVKRGREWWPFATPLASSPSLGKRVESMTEDEIFVNGTAMLNIHDLERSRQSFPKELLLETDSQLAEPDGFYLVKIEGFTRNQAQVDALTQAGAVLGEYLNINTYVAKIPATAYAAVKALPFVTFIGDYEPAYKISPRIGFEEIPVAEATDPSTGEPRPWVLEVTLHNGAYVQDVLNDLARLQIFPEPDDIISNDAMTYLRLRTVPDAVPALSMIPGIKFIAEKTYPQLHASSAFPATIPMVLQNNGVYTTNTSIGWKLWNAGIDGTGQIVTMMDSGLNTKMEHFAQDTLNSGTVGPAHRKVVGYDLFGGGDQCVIDNNAAPDGGHGGKTSQHAVGSISNMTTNPDTAHTPNVHFDNGIARGAKVYFQDAGNPGTPTGISPPSDLGPSITAAIGKGSFIQNHSWGTPNNTYDALSSNLDTALFNNPNMVVTVSAGNNGGISTLGSPSTAKNAICVGGNDVSSPNNLYIDAGGGSSRGPVFGSGRTKPDIMAFFYANSPVGGEQMAYSAPTAMCQTDAVKTPYWSYANLTPEGGTSYAAPEIAGLAALVRDYFVRGFYPTGSAVPANAITPSGSLVKAVILASGEDMATTAFPQTSVAIGKRYSSDVGYGRANLPAALHVGGTAPFLWVKNNDTLGDGLTKTFFYNINGNGLPLRVMMVYYDAGTGDALQKDADLKVTIGANTYWGNNFSGGWSTNPLTPIRDHTNNTEGVFLDAAHGLPASGTIRVDVIGYNNPAGMNYSLVVVGNVASDVTQVNMDQGSYTCNDTVKITVNDVAGVSPASVTLVSKDSSSTTIDTKIVSCTGSNGVFVGTIQTGSGIVVADGGSLTATYLGAIAPAISAVSCNVGARDAGFALNGGCDNTPADTDFVTGPLASGGLNEFYTPYMDGGEYTSYEFRFQNMTGFALTDATVALSFSGAGAAKMSVFNNPIHIGAVPVDGVVGGVFQLFTDPSVAPLTSVDMNFDITSPADGYTLATRLTQVQVLQANDQVSRQASCQTFNTSLGGFKESTKVTRGGLTTALNTWHWAGPTQPVGAELRVDGACGNATNNAVAMTGGSLSTANFNNNADSFLFINFQPALRGNAPNGQPYRYAWKWHSFYHSSEQQGNESGAWAPFYNDKWNKATAPTGDELVAFPIRLPAYYSHEFFDYPYAPGPPGVWNWDSANGGTPDDPHLDPDSGGAPNQLILKFNNNATGLATADTWFAYGHEHADAFFFNGGSHGTHRDIALDNDRLVYDEFYAEAQAGASCGGGGQLGQVAFDQPNYSACPSGSAVVSIVDANGVSGMQVTVTSPGTGDSELVTLAGSAPYFSRTINLSTIAGVGVNNGTLFVLPSETINVVYTDASPAGSTTALATTSCVGGDVIYLSNAQIFDNGDNDGFPDNNETVTLDLTVKNNSVLPITNAKVTILSDSPTIDCISDAQANYGTIDANAEATNPAGDRFTFHVAPSVACSDSLNPPLARFVVVITGDGIDGAQTLQRFTVSLDLDPTATGGPYTLSQNFNTDPGWATGVTPDDDDVSGCGGYVNDFHWCAACGNGGGGYGAWVGNEPFGTEGQYYNPDFPNSSTLYSPPLVANGNVTLQFNLAYRVEWDPGGGRLFDGAIVQSRVGGGAWTTILFSTPPQGPIFPDDSLCNPLIVSEHAWTGDGPPAPYWTTTNAASVSATAGQEIQFRWRLGGDVSGAGEYWGAPFGGFGVDNVTITNLKQTTVCEPTRNTGLPACTSTFCQTHPNGTACDDGNACTSGDICASGSCAGTIIPAPAEAQSVSAAANKQTFTWAATPNATAYDAIHGLLSALPVGPGGGDEACFNNLPAPSLVEPTVPSPGTGLYILVRGKNTSCPGTYGTQKNGTPRVSTTCP
jgi:hypothetical protein